MSKKEVIDVVDLFEKYRPLMDTLEMREQYGGWNPESSVEEYITDESYGHGVNLFIEHIEVITDKLFTFHSSKFHKYPDSYDSTYEEVILERNDGKFFKLDVCEEFGEYDEEMIQVNKRTKTITKTVFD